MKAMIATRFGGPEVLEMKDVKKPQPGATELLVRVVATSVNPVDTKLRKHGQAFGAKPPLILGFDCSGVVEAVGDEVQEFEPGDEVFYTSEIATEPGCNAEFHVVKEEIVALKPENLSHEEAAAIPLAAATAWQALIMRGALAVGDRVLIHGAGGVGHFAIQIALAAGARVIATCSDTMIDTVWDWGVDRAIHYRKENFADIVEEMTEGEGVGLVFNTVGGDLLTQSIPVTTPFGRLIGILDPEGDLKGAYRKNLTIELVFVQRERQTMQALRDLVLADKLKPLVDSVFELKDLAKAHRKLEKGGLKGKIVVRVAE